MRTSNWFTDSHHIYLNRSRNLTRRHLMRDEAGAGGGTGGAGSATGTATGSDSSTGSGTGAGTGSSGSQSGTGTGTGTGAGTGSQPLGTTTDTGTGDIDGVRDGDFRTLRTKYTEAKAKAAQLEALGLPPEQAKVAATRFLAMQTEVGTVGKALGYDDAEIAAAFEADPIGLINLLRTEKAEADKGKQTVPKTAEEQAQWIRDQVAEQTKPYTEHINKQISDAVTAKIGTEFDTHYKAALPDTPPEVRSLVEDYVIEFLKGDNSSLVAMKARGDYATVKKVVDVVATRLKTTFAAWQQAEMKRTGQRTTGDNGQQGQQGQQGTKRLTLDQMIDDPGLINSKYAE